jgi:hypothetical protein
VAKLGDGDTAGTELRRAFKLAEQLLSPTLVYQAACDLGQWYETTGQEWEAAMLYGKAKAAAEHTVTTIEDEALSAIYLQSAPVQVIYDCASRLGSETPPASSGA